MTLANSKPRVLICDSIAPIGVEMLREHAEVDIKTGLDREALLAIIDQYQAVIVRSATKITAEVIERATRLQVIGRAGAGLDNIDVAVAKSRNIEVVNSPNANTLAVAEHTLALLLAVVRHLTRADVSLKEGKWEKGQLMGMGLAGKTLGIIGFGRIGRQVAIRAQAFGMKVVVNQRRPTPELNLELGVEAVDLNELLRVSDFVTLHVPAKPETENLIGAEQLALMKPTAYLINTARGTVVDEESLLEALDDGQIRGAALDVFVEEPATHNALARHPKVIATPHIAASTEDAQQSGAVTVARQIIDLLRDEAYENPLSLAVVPLDKIFPHESVDPRRVEKLAARLETDGVLVNPPVVMAIGGRYVVLDGATRTAALRDLNYPCAVVQVVADKDRLSLDTWFHAIRQATPAALVDLLAGIAEITMIESTPQTVIKDMVEYNGVCYIHTVTDQVFHIQPAAGVNHLDALNKVTETYIKAYAVDRTLSHDIKQVRQEYPDLTALVVFPEYTVNHVLQIVQAGRALPAGITRFIIPGRVLRINVDLNELKADKSLHEKNKQLNRLILDKIDKGRIRYYEEPVYLLDE